MPPFPSAGIWTASTSLAVFTTSSAFRPLHSRALPHSIPRVLSNICSDCHSCRESPNPQPLTRSTTRLAGNLPTFLARASFLPSTQASVQGGHHPDPPCNDPSVSHSPAESSQSALLTPQSPFPHVVHPGPVWLWMPRGVFPPELGWQAASLTHPEPRVSSQALFGLGPTLSPMRSTGGHDQLLSHDALHFPHPPFTAAREHIFRGKRRAHLSF